MRDRGRGDAVRDGDGGMTEGCKDTLFVLLHIDAVVATHGRDIHTAHTHTLDNGKLPAAQCKRGVAKRAQLINPTVLGLDR